MKSVIVEPLRHQFAFVTSQAPLTILLGGRGCGKSAGIGMLSAKCSIEGRSGIHVAPTYKILREVTYEAIAFWLRKFGVNYHYNKTEMRFDVSVNGLDSKILLVSAESPERLRGLTNYHYLCIDEAPICDELCYSLGKPCLRGANVRNPQVYFASTPRGRGNWVSRLVDSPSTNYIVAKTKDNHHNGPDFYRQMLDLYRDMPEFALQELEGVILDSNLNSLFRDEHWVKFTTNTVNTQGGLIAGLDVAGCGEDYTVLSIREGMAIKELYKIRTPSLDDLTRFVTLKLNGRFCNSISIDSTGIGAFVPGELKKFLPNTHVLPVNFGSSSFNPAYNNRRTEIHFDLRKMINDGLSLQVNDSTLVEELRQEFFAVEMDLDNNRRFKLTPKDDMRKKLSRSPDVLDSIALCAITSHNPFDLDKNKKMIDGTSNPFAGVKMWGS